MRLPPDMNGVETVHRMRTLADILKQQSDKPVAAAEFRNTDTMLTEKAGPVHKPGRPFPFQRSFSLRASTFSSMRRIVSVNT